MIATMRLVAIVGVLLCCCASTLAIEHEDAHSDLLDRSIDVAFVNRADAPVELYWLNAHQERVHMATLSPGTLPLALA